MFDGWTKPKFYAKCKSALRHTRTRLVPIRKKRGAVEKFLKKDIADLLKDSLDYNAYLRADMLLVEQNMTACYDIIEQFCRHISIHLSDMQNERDFPLQCREAAASLAYAAARFADLPDLRQLRSLFTERYGDSFESFASKKFVGKLKADPPTKDMKLQLLHNIAQDFSLDWDPKALEQKLFTPSPAHQDLPKRYALFESNEKWHENKDKDDLSTRNKHREDRFEQNEVIDETRRDRISSSSIGTVPDDNADNERPSYAFMNPPYTKPSDNKPIQKARSVNRRQPLSDHNEYEDEERVLDGLLLHYSTKKSTHDEGRVRAALEENGRRPRTAKSMPVSELESSAGKATKTHARYSSIELGGHVHPMLPDYDELAARIAALSET